MKNIIIFSTIYLNNYSNSILLDFLLNSFEEIEDFFMYDICDYNNDKFIQLLSNNVEI